MQEKVPGNKELQVDVIIRGPLALGVDGKMSKSRRCDTVIGWMNEWAWVNVGKFRARKRKGKVREYV